VPAAPKFVPDFTANLTRSAVTAQYYKGPVSKPVVSPPQAAETKSPGKSESDNKPKPALSTVTETPIKALAAEKKDLPAAQPTKPISVAFMQYAGLLGKPAASHPPQSLGTDVVATPPLQTTTKVEPAKLMLETFQQYFKNETRFLNPAPAARSTDEDIILADASPIRPSTPKAESKPLPATAETSPKRPVVKTIDSRPKFTGISFGPPPPIKTQTNTPFSIPEQQHTRAPSLSAAAPPFNPLGSNKENVAPSGASNAESDAKKLFEQRLKQKGISASTGLRASKYAN
jgi:hypothetical protein